MLVPRCFETLIQQAGGTRRLAREAWRHLEPSVSQTDLYHLGRLAAGGASLRYVESRFTPQQVIGALEHTAPPNGRPRSRELVRTQEGLLAGVRADGCWRSQRRPGRTL